MKVMAIDYGDARTGVAVSDATGLLAGFATVVHGYRREAVAEEIARLAKAHGAERLVLGLPRNMDGSEGPRAQLCREFGALLEETTGL